MHWTLPPLEGRVEMSLLGLRVTGKAAVERSPVKGATMLDWAGLARATAAVETIIEEAISLSLSLSLSARTAMAMATASAVLPITGGARQESQSLHPTKLKMLAGRQSQLAFPQKQSQLNPRRNLSVCAEYNDGSRGGGGDFLAGFLLGGALFGTLAYVFAPQIRRSILNEDEYGFQKAKKPIYYDEGLEKTRQTLNEKINQLNSAIDNVSSRLRGRNNVVADPVEADSEIEATM